MSTIQNRDSSHSSPEDLYDDVAVSFEPSEDTSLIEEEPPPKGGFVVYFCFLVLGLGTLLPWNFFITAESYWMYKFRNVSNDSNGDDFLASNKTYLQNVYTPCQVTLSQLTNFFFLFINAIYSQFFPQKVRLVGSLLIMITFFSVTTGLVRVRTDDWQTGFFILTMIIIIIMNASGAICQGGVYGVAGMFPLKFINAVGIGQALGGIFASVARIASIYFGVDAVTSAFIYFLIAVFVMILTLVEYLYVSHLDFFKFYTNIHNEDESVLKPRMSFKLLLKDHYRIFKKIWALGISVAIVFLVTLAVFPVICVRILSTSDNKIWAGVYFQPVITFLLFNVCDYASRQLAEFIMWPRRGSQILVLVTLRVIFIPLFLLCSHDLNSYIPSVFTNDAWYISFMIGFASSNGYCCALCMMYAPRMVAQQDAEKAGTMMAAVIGLGLLLGAALSFLFALIIT